MLLYNFQSIIFYYFIAKFYVDQKSINFRGENRDETI